MRIARIPTRGQIQAFSTWRTIALGRMPYMAPYLFAVRVLDAPDQGTFAVDEQMRMYIDFDAVAAWGDSACAQVLLHEVGHLFADHFGQAREVGITPAEHRFWNAATDASLNDDLAQAGCDYIAETGVMPAQFREPDFQTAQHYYAALRNLQQQRQCGEGQPGGRADGDDGPAAREGDDPGKGRDVREGDPPRQGSVSSAGRPKNEGPFTGCGSGSGGEASPWELEPEDDLGGQAPGATVTERALIQLSTAAAVRKHASTGRGTMPAGLIEQAQLVLTVSKTPWQRVLAPMIRRCGRLQAGHTRPNYTRRDRRRHDVRLRPGGPNVVFPGRGRPKICVALVRDTSASEGDEELASANQEVLTIARRLRIKGSDLQVIDVDTEVHATRNFRRAADLVQVHGRGGTDMRVGIERALTAGADVIVVVTDGGTPWPSLPVGVPVVACLVGEPGARNVENVPAWIKTVVAKD